MTREDEIAMCNEARDRVAVCIYCSSKGPFVPPTEFENHLNACATIERGLALLLPATKTADVVVPPAVTA